MYAGWYFVIVSATCICHRRRCAAFVKFFDENFRRGLEPDIRSKVRIAVASVLSAWALASCMTVGAAEPSRLLVQPRAGLPLEELDGILRVHGARRVSVIQQINVHVVELPPHSDPQAVARTLKQNPHIEAVEVDERLPPAGR
jgi:hypothetical protein